MTMDMPMTLLLDVPSQAVGKNNFTSGSTYHDYVDAYKYTTGVQQNQK